MLISKALVVGTYQRKAEEIAAHPGIDLTVVVPPQWKDVRGDLLLERVHTEGYTLAVEPIRFNGSFHLHTYPGLPRLLQQIRPHIVHIDEEPYNLATYLALRAAHKVGAKTLFFTWQNIERRYPPPFSWIERAVLRGVDHAIAGTQEAADVWRAKGYAGPLTVIPQFGVDPDFFTPAPSPRSDDVFTIGCAGRLVEEKGLDVLIRAMTRVPGQTCLLLAGDGPQRDEILRLAGIYNIGGCVQVLGGIPSTQMPEFYRSLDALVLPSLTRPNWKEQFGRVLIEAMACGVPVIGSNSGAIPEVIGDAGLIVPEGDAEALSVALASLVEHPRLRQQLSDAGRARVLAHFTQSQVAAETVNVYRNMVTSTTAL
jgi:glycosyltransferase involved in cell wall biosynthesis